MLFIPGLTHLNLNSLTYQKDSIFAGCQCSRYNWNALSVNKGFEFVAVRTRDVKPLHLGVRWPEGAFRSLRLDAGKRPLGTVLAPTVASGGVKPPPKKAPSSRRTPKSRPAAS